MIDWANLAANSLWILGLTLALATLSYASWQASLARQKFRARLSHPTIQMSLNIAGVLFCAGLAATSTRWWEIAVWAALALAFAVQVGVGVYTARRNHHKGVKDTKMAR